MLKNKMRWMMGGLMSLGVVSTAVFAGCTDTQITSVDAGTLVDASPGDTGLADVVSTTDGGTDAKPDVELNDSGLPPLTLENYLVRLGISYGVRAQQCCQPLDAGTFDKDRFLADSNMVGGFEKVAKGIAKSQANQISFDEAKAKDCLNKLESLPCTYSDTDLSATRQACLDAVVGTGVKDAVCTDSVQCAKGFYCTSDGNTAGKCAALLAVGDTCDDVTYKNDQCSYRGSGKGCNKDTKKCVDLLPNGESCVPTNLFASSCQSGLCKVAGNTCGNADSLVTFDACDYYRKPVDAGTDAGDGG
jgi:hypothetical protein